MKKLALPLSVPVMMCALFASEAMAQSAPPRVYVSSSPSVVIDGASADADVIAVVSWATRLRDGAIAITDAENAAVHIFSSNGRHLKTIGRRGSGPGEFQVPLWGGACGSSVVAVWDIVASRLTMISMDSGYPLTSRSVPDARASLLAACSATNRSAFATSQRPRTDLPPLRQGSTPSGGQYSIIRLDEALTVFDSSGRTETETLSEISTEYVMGRTAPSGGGFSFPRPLGFGNAIAFSGEVLVVGESESGTITGYSEHGRVIFGFTLSQSGARPDSISYSRAVLQSFTMVPARARSQLEAFAVSLPAPDKTTPFWRILTDPSGLIWAVVSPQGSATTQLDGFSTSGARVASLRFDGGLIPFEVGTDYVLGRTEASDGTHRVLLYRLERQ